MMSPSIGGQLFDLVIHANLAGEKIVHEADFERPKFPTSGR